MGGKPLKKKKCTIKCAPDCASNPANHIPHEHLIAATSALVMAIAGIIMTIPTVEAAPKRLPPKVVYEVSCRDTDGGKLPEQAGSTVLLRINTKDKSIKRTSIKEDECLSKTIVREYFCAKNKIVSQQIRCKKGEVCMKGGCVDLTKFNAQLPSSPTSSPTSTLPTPTSTSTPTTTPPVLPTSGLVGYCVLSGITGGDFTKIQSPDSGYGYAQLRKGSVSRIEDLYAACSVADFANLEAQYCSVPNQPPYSRNAVTYDSTGFFKEFGGCHSMFGCEYQSCPNSNYGTQPTQTTSTTSTPNNPPQNTCTDTDGGKNEDVKGDVTGLIYGYKRPTSTDYCLQDGSTLIEHYCTAESGNVPLFASSTVSCASGMCSNGACITPTSP